MLHAPLIEAARRLARASSGCFIGRRTGGDDIVIGSTTVQRRNDAKASTAHRHRRRAWPLWFSQCRGLRLSGLSPGRTPAMRCGRRRSPRPICASRSAAAAAQETPASRDSARDPGPKEGSSRSLCMALEELSSALPDDTWLTNFRSPKASCVSAAHRKASPTWSRPCRNRRCSPRRRFSRRPRGLPRRGRPLSSSDAAGATEGRRQMKWNVDIKLPNSRAPGRRGIARLRHRDLWRPV